MCSNDEQTKWCLGWRERIRSPLGRGQTHGELIVGLALSGQEGPVPKIAREGFLHERVTANTELGGEGQGSFGDLCGHVKLRKKQ